MELKDKVIVITGSGRGLGQATSILCAENGAKVVVSDIKEEWGKETVRLIEKAGGTASFKFADVSKEQDVENLVQYAVDTYGKLDGFVNNAANIVVKRADQLSSDEWHGVLGVILDGTFYGSKHAIRQFKKQKSGGSIVNMASISAVVGLPEQAVYCAAKGGVFQLTRQMAIDYAKENIRCNTIGPGSIKGEFLDVYLDNQSNPDTARDVIIGNHPIARLAEPREVSEAIVFLLSDRASFITGSNLQVDGGYTAI